MSSELHLGLVLSVLVFQLFRLGLEELLVVSLVVVDPPRVLVEDVRGYLIQELLVVGHYQEGRGPILREGHKKQGEEPRGQKQRCHLDQ